MKSIFKYEATSDHRHLVKINNEYSTKIIGEFIKDVDGFFYFFLNDYNGGSISAEALGELSNKLIEMNREWNNYISENLDVS